MTTATSRVQIEQDIVELLASLDAASQLLPVPLAATTTAADTTSIRCTTLDRGNPSTGTYDGMIVKIVDDTGAGPAVGETSKVVSAGYDGTDKITVSPAFTAAVISGQQFMLYPSRWIPELIVSTMRRVLRNTRVPVIWAPSLVADPDLTASDTLVTNWTDVGAPTTTDFETGAANILFGEKSIKVIGGAATGIASASFPVHDVQSVLVVVPVAVAAGSMTVVLYRATATAADLHSVTMDEIAFTDARFIEAFTDGTKQAQLRFLAAAAATTFYVSPHIIVQALGVHSYALPSWLVNPNHILAATFLPSGSSAEDTDNYVPLSHPMIASSGFKILRSERDVTPLRVQFYGGTYPLYLKVLRQAADLSTDAATTIVDRNWLVKKVASILLRNRGDSEWRRVAGEAAQAAREAGYAVPSFTVEEALTAR
jgi:hypothetical protein